MQLESKVNKSLWKSITKQKIKQSPTEYNYTSHINSDEKKSSFNSEPIGHRNQYVEKIDLGEEWDKIGNDFHLEVQDCEQMDLGIGKKNHHEVTGKMEIKNKIKVRRPSAGEQSVVEEIVDLKNAHIFYTNQIQDQEQPMMMSLGSEQKILTFPHLKWQKVKQQIQKLKTLKQDYNKFIKKLTQENKQLCEQWMNNSIAFILDFYESKLVKIQNTHKNEQMLTREVSSESQNLGASLNFQRQSETDTPRFPPKFGLTKSQNSEKKLIDVCLQLQQKKQEIQRLQEQLFKSKCNIQDYLEKIEQIQLQNESMQQQIFDYQQRIAQIDLQVADKVSKILFEKGQKSKQSQQFQQLKREYLYQIEQLQSKVDILSKNQQKQLIYLEREQQIINIQQKMRKKEKEIKQKQRSLIQFQESLNSIKIQYQLRIQKLDTHERQIRQKLEEIQLKQNELVEKQKQFVEKELQLFRNNFQKNVTKLQYEQTPYQNQMRLKKLSDLRPKITTQHYPISHRNPSSSSSYRLQQKPWKVGNEISSYRNNVQISSSKNSRSKNNSKQKQRIRRGEKKNQSQIISSSFVTANNFHSSAIKNGDKRRLEDLGSKLQNLRQQIRKQIRETS